jgi:hypothetical protein
MNYCQRGKELLIALQVYHVTTSSASRVHCYLPKYRIASCHILPQALGLAAGVRRGRGAERHEGDFR